MPKSKTGGTKAATNTADNVSHGGGTTQHPTVDGPAVALTNDSILEWYDAQIADGTLNWAANMPGTPTHWREAILRTESERAGGEALKYTQREYTGIYGTIALYRALDVCKVHGQHVAEAQAAYREILRKRIIERRSLLMAEAKKLSPAEAAAERETLGLTGAGPLTQRDLQQMEISGPLTPMSQRVHDLMSDSALSAMMDPQYHMSALAGTAHIIAILHLNTRIIDVRNVTRAVHAELITKKWTLRTRPQRAPMPPTAPITIHATPKSCLATAVRNTTPVILPPQDKQGTRERAEAAARVPVYPRTQKKRPDTSFVLSMATNIETSKPITMEHWRVIRALFSQIKEHGAAASFTPRTITQAMKRNKAPNSEAILEVYNTLQELAQYRLKIEALQELKNKLSDVDAEAAALRLRRETYLVPLEFDTAQALSRDGRILAERVKINFYAGCVPPFFEYHLALGYYSVLDPAVAAIQRVDADGRLMFHANNKPVLIPIDDERGRLMEYMLERIDDVRHWHAKQQSKIARIGKPDAPRPNNARVMHPTIVFDTALRECGIATNGPHRNRLAVFAIQCFEYWKTMPDLITDFRYDTSRRGRGERLEKIHFSI